MQPLITDAELVEELLVVSAKWVKVTIKREELQRRRVGCRTDTNLTWSFYQMNIAKTLTVRWSRKVYLKLKKCQAGDKNLKNWLQWEHQFIEGSQTEHSRSKLWIYWRINYSRVQSRKHIKSAKNIWRRRQEEWGRSCSQHIPRWPWWPRPPWSRPGWTLLPSTSW